MMKPQAILFVCILAAVYCQSTNPAGTPYFSPSIVHELTFNTNFSSTFAAGSPLPDYYYVFVPENTAGVVYTIYTSQTCYTNQSSYAINIELVMDYSSLPCDVSGAYFCSGNRASYQIPTGYGKASFNYKWGFIPGIYHYFNVTLRSPSTTNCPYKISVTPIVTCPSGSVTFQPPPSKTQNVCLNVTAVINDNNQTLSDNFANTTHVYRINVPPNSTHFQATLQTKASDLFLYLSQSLPTVCSSCTSGESALPVSYNNLTKIYTYQLTQNSPDPDTPVYISVQPLHYVFYNYNITFTWNYCGADKGGDGYSDGSPTPCAFPVVYNNLDLASGITSYTFNFNPEDKIQNSTQVAKYAFSSIPWGTVGSYNITCSSTSNSSYLAWSKDSLAICSYPSIQCNKPNSFLALLSQDLWIGGNWSIAACVDASTLPTTVTLNLDNPVLPAPPSSSPSPSSSITPSRSSYPSQSPWVMRSPSSYVGDSHKGNNAGIIVVAVLVPLLVIGAVVLGVVGYGYWKKTKKQHTQLDEEEEQEMNPNNHESL